MNSSKLNIVVVFLRFSYLFAVFAPLYTENERTSKLTSVLSHIHLIAFTITTPFCVTFLSVNRRNC